MKGVDESFLIWMLRNVSWNLLELETCQFCLIVKTGEVFISVSDDKYSRLEIVGSVSDKGLTEAFGSLSYSVSDMKPQLDATSNNSPLLRNHCMDQTF